MNARPLSLPSLYPMRRRVGEGGREAGDVAPKCLDCGHDGNTLTFFFKDIGEENINYYCVHPSYKTILFFLLEPTTDGVCTIAIYFHASSHK